MSILSEKSPAVNSSFERSPFDSFDSSSDAASRAALTSARAAGKVVVVDELKGFVDEHDVSKMSYRDSRVLRGSIHSALSRYEQFLLQNGSLYLNSLESNKIYRMGHCSKYPELVKVTDFAGLCSELDDSRLKWRDASPRRCHTGFCPVCIKADANNLQREVIAVSDALIAAYPDEKLTPVYTVLTCKDCSAFELPFAKMVLQGALDYLFGSRQSMVFNRSLISPVDSRFPDVLFKDGFYTFECTINTGEKRGKIVKSDYYGCFHPHINILSFVPEDYFKNRHYLKQSELEKVWIACLEKSCARLQKICCKTGVKVPATWFSWLLEYRRLEYGKCFYSPADAMVAPDGVSHLNHFDSSRFIDYNSGIPSVSVYMRRARGKKSMSAVTSAVLEACKYTCKMDDVAQLARDDDSLSAYFTIGYAVFRQNLPPVKRFGRFRDIYLELNKTGSLNLSPDEYVVLDGSLACVKFLQDIFVSASPDGSVPSDFDSVLRGELSGQSAVDWLLGLCDSAGLQVFQLENGAYKLLLSELRTCAAFYYRRTGKTLTGRESKKRGRKKDFGSRFFTDDGFGIVSTPFD